MSVVGGCGAVENHCIVEHGFQVCLDIVPGGVGADLQLLSHLSEAHWALDH